MPKGAVYVETADILNADKIYDETNRVHREKKIYFSNEKIFSVNSVVG